MTANQDQIQRLLSEVQDVLAQGNPRLPWGSVAQVARQRRVLEQVRLYLQNVLFQLNQGTAQTGNQAQDVMQAVIEEMNALRSTLLRPLHSEVATLMQQRNALTREVRQLEAHRQLLEQSTPEATRQSAEKLPTEKLQVVHARADQVLTTLDTTLHVVFESLQKDIQAYQDSLSQGIDKLHNLGQQSEVMFSGMIGRLASEMGRDASAFLQNSSEQTALLDSAGLSMPYAGTELPRRVQLETQDSSLIDSITVLTELIDQLAIEVDEFPVSVPVIPPRNGSRSGQVVPPDLKSLFQGDSPKVESASPPFAYGEIGQTAFDSLQPSIHRAVSSAEEPVIFTLEGVEDLFVEDSENHSNG